MKEEIKKIKKQLVDLHKLVQNELMDIYKRLTNLEREYGVGELKC